MISISPVGLSLPVRHIRRSTSFSIMAYTENVGLHSHPPTHYINVYRLWIWIWGRVPGHRDKLDTGQGQYRDPIMIIRFLLQQRTFIGDLVYAPIREYNTVGERIFTEMH